MDYEKEMKERFVQMLKDRQILIVAGQQTAKNGDGDYKFIGANNDGKWDFTLLLGQLSGCSVRSDEWKQGVKNPIHTFIRTKDPFAVIQSALIQLAITGFFNDDIKDNYKLYEYTREQTAVFYF